MNSIHIFIVFLLPYLLNNVESVSEYRETKLVLVQAMFRHGVRSVLLTYPNDTKQDVWYRYGGLGQLTPVGMKQLNQYGIYFRNKYRKFLNPVYNRSRVFARSTDYDRTLQSVQSFLSAVYKPSPDQKWTHIRNLTGWLPIPVHTTSLATDQILHANAPCPRYDDLRAEMRSTPEYLALQSANQGFLDKMTNLSGLTNLNYYMMWQIADKAMVEKAHNLRLDKYIRDNYKKIMLINDYTFYIDFVTVEMGKLISGGLLNDIVSNINKKVNNGTLNELYVYGVHDNYVAGMQKLLNTSTNFVQPNFASGFVFELRQDKFGKYYVQILSKNNEYPSPEVLEKATIYGCDQLCPLEQFLEIVSDNLVTDFTEICKSSEV